MKGRLITNGVLSLITSSLLIFLLVSLFSALSSAISNGDAPSKGLIMSAAASQAIITVSWISSVVMGIVTLSMQKDERVKGLTIASGVLAILNGMLFANAIVSFIAVYKMSK